MPSDPITLVWKDLIISAINSLTCWKLEGPTVHDSSTMNTMSAVKAVLHSGQTHTEIQTVAHTDTTKKNEDSKTDKIIA